MALMSYLIRDAAGTYYFRRVIPPALRPFMPSPWTGKSAWKRTLGTKDPARAKRTAARLLSDCAADLEAAERVKRGEAVMRPARPAVSLNPADIERDVLAELLAADEAERAEVDPRKQLQTAEERAQWPDLSPVAFGRRGMAEDHHHAYGEELAELHADYRKALSRSDPSIVDGETRRRLREAGEPIDPTSDAYHEAGMVVLRAHVQAYGLMRDRQRGEAVTTPAPSAGRGPKLSEAHAGWKTGSEARGTRKRSPRTFLEADHAVRRLTE